LLDWQRVEYAIEKPSNKVLAVADLDSDTWVRSKKGETLKPETGGRKAESENQGRYETRPQRTGRWGGQEAAAARRALRLGISAFPSSVVSGRKLLFSEAARDVEGGSEAVKA
jgi:hypothetical protein